MTYNFIVISIMRAPFLEQSPHLNSFRQLRERSKADFLSLLFLKNNKLNIINIPEKHILEGQPLFLSYANNFTYGKKEH